MKQSKRSGPEAPAAGRRKAVQVAPRERVFGGPTPEGPLPGRILVQLSRLHRAEAGRREDVADRRDG